MIALAWAEAFGTIDPWDAQLRSGVALHLVDALACLDAAAGTREGRAIAAFYAEAEARAGLSRPMQAACAAALIRFTEWDDIHVPSCATPGAIAVPVAAALATDPDRLVAAIEAGYATGISLSEAAGGVEALTRGVWPTLLAAPAIAAASASLALGLSREETAQALVMSLAGSSGRGGRPTGSPSARWLAIGEATLRGVRAALAARAGFRGDLTLLSPAWLEAQVGSEIARPDRLQDLAAGAVASVGIKPFVAARQGTNAIEAIRQILAEGASLSNVEEIRVSLPRVAVPVVTRPLDLEDRLSSIAHLGLQLALAVREPERLHDAGRERPFEAETVALASRITIVSDDGLPQENRSWPAKVAVRVGGRWTELVCLRVPGDAGDDSAALALVERKVARASSGAARRLNAILSDLPAGRGNPLRDAASLMHESVTAAAGSTPHPAREMSAAVA